MFKVGEIDVKGLQQFENMLGALGEKAPRVVNHALNRTGDMAQTQVIKTLAVQTGLQQKIIRKSMTSTRASDGYPQYVLHSVGGNVSVKHFKKRETKDGVVAFLGRAHGNELFAEAFFRGGAFPRHRVKIRSMGGHVFNRAGGRTQLERVDSDVVIPAEMVDGASAAAFADTVNKILPRRLDHEISRLLGL